MATIDINPQVLIHRMLVIEKIINREDNDRYKNLPKELNLNNLFKEKNIWNQLSNEVL